MKTLYSIFASMLLVCTVQTASFGQSLNITETFKKHFNETVQEVQDTDDADEKRAILEAFEKLGALVKIKAREILEPQHINDIRGFQNFDNADIDQKTGFAKASS